MNAQEAVKQQLGFWHGILGNVMADCGDQELNANLPNAHIGSIASIYAHAVFSEDGIVNGLLQGKPALYESGGWEAKTGVKWPGIPPLQTPEWSAAVKMQDRAAFDEYARAVYANTEAYVGSLSDADLDRKTQGPIGETTVGFMVINILGTHLTGHAGEIAALKGVQGLKGLPF
jgi:hypothetical protein